MTLWGHKEDNLIGNNKHYVRLNDERGGGGGREGEERGLILYLYHL